MNLVREDEPGSPFTFTYCFLALSFSFSLSPTSSSFPSWPGPRALLHYIQSSDAVATVAVLELTWAGAQGLASESEMDNQSRIEDEPGHE